MYHQNDLQYNVYDYIKFLVIFLILNSYEVSVALGDTIFVYGCPIIWISVDCVLFSMVYRYRIYCL